MAGYPAVYPWHPTLNALYNAAAPSLAHGVRNQNTKPNDFAVFFGEMSRTVVNI